MNPLTVTHPMHQPLTSRERLMRVIWIFGAVWLFLWLLLFWFQPVWVFRTERQAMHPDNEVVRVVPWEQLRQQARPGEPTRWEQFMLEQGFPILALYFILSIPAWLASVLGRSRSWWAGGIIGVLVGYIGGWLFVDSVVGLGGAIVVGLLGAIFDYLVSTHYKIRLLKGRMPSWWAGGHWGGRGHSRWRWPTHGEVGIRN